MVITLILMLLIAVVMGFFTLFGVYMGLKWNYQIKVEQKPPEFPAPKNPVKELVQQVTDARQEKETQTILEEWINGPPKEGE